MEQRANIKFYFKPCKTTTETIQQIKMAYGDNALSVTWVSEWYWNGLIDLKKGVRIFRIIQEAGVLKLLKMQTQLQISSKW
jgi:hypothetical protein